MSWSWLEVAETGIREYSARKIIRDSDGNPARLRYREGAAEAAAEAANKQISYQASVDALVRTLETFEEVDLCDPESRKVS